MRIYKNTKLVQGVGIKGDNPCRDENGKIIPAYKTWSHMLERAYSAKWHAVYPTYIGCSVAEEWFHYDNFKKWYDVNYIEGMFLDKDLLVEGNKIYGPTTCRFVPATLNTLFSDCRSSRGQYPIGVYFNKPSGRFLAHLSVNGKQKCLGYFETPVEAHATYLTAKKSYSTMEVNRYLANGDIERDLYLSLIRKIANLN